MAMGPGEFNRRLDALVGEARRAGLAPSHVKNALQAKNQSISHQEWRTKRERERGIEPRGAFSPIEDDL